MSKSGIKNALLEYFCTGTLEFVKIEYLTHALNFVIRFAFSEGPGSRRVRFKVCS